jgi:hypothetical protein
MTPWLRNGCSASRLTESGWTDSIVAKGPSPGPAGQTSGRLGHVIYQPCLVYTSHGLVYHKWYIPILWYTMVYHTQNAPYHMCDIPPVICNCDITEQVWYIACDITSMVYTILWYTIKCDIPWYMDTVYTIPCMRYNMLYGYDIYHAIYHPNISWYIPCDIPYMWYYTCDIPYMWYTMVYGYGIYHTMYDIWHIIYHQWDISWYIACDIPVQYIYWYIPCDIPHMWYHTCYIP